MKRFSIIALCLLTVMQANTQTNYQSSNIIIDGQVLQLETGTDSYAFLGIYSDQVSKTKAKKLGFDNPYGSYVSSVIPGTAADRAGIQPLDYLYGVDEYRPGEDQSFTSILRKFRAGDRATIHLIRKGKKMTLPVTFGSREDSRGRRERDKCEEPFFGISAQSWSNQKVDGVPVSIVKNSTAKSIGMQDGDLITAMNGHTIIDWSDVTIAIDNMEVGQSITVDFVRNGRNQQLSGRIKSYCETKNIKPESQSELRNAPEPGDWFNRYFQDETENERERRRGTRGINTSSNISISIQEMDQEDARSVRREKGIELRESGPLSVKNLTFSADARHNRFKLSFSLPQSGPTVVKVFNDSGRMIYNYDLGSFSGDFEDEIDITQEGTSSYYLEISQGNRANVRMLTISKS
jgi:membrane-associated protease RseP (regulator of RpoE activity)